MECFSGASVAGTIVKCCGETCEEGEVLRVSGPALDFVIRGIGSGEKETCRFLPAAALVRGVGDCGKPRKEGAHGALAELGLGTAMHDEPCSLSTLAETPRAGEAAGAPVLSKRTTVRDAVSTVGEFAGGCRGELGGKAPWAVCSSRRGGAPELPPEPEPEPEPGPGSVLPPCSPAGVLGCGVSKS